MRMLVILASGVFFASLALSDSKAAIGPARLAQPQGFLTQAQYYPGWRHHPGWRGRYAYAQPYTYPGGRHRYPGWRWRHPGWRWGY